MAAAASNAVAASLPRAARFPWASPEPLCQGYLLPSRPKPGPRWAGFRRSARLRTRVRGRGLQVEPLSGPGASAPARRIPGGRREAPVSAIARCFKPLGFVHANALPSKDCCPYSGGKETEARERLGDFLYIT